MLLQETGARMGLGPAAIDEIVRGAQLGTWRKNQPIFGPEDTSDLVNFIVSGAVKVTAATAQGTVCVQMARPGQFFGLNWFARRGQPRLFLATAFTDSIVAMVSSEMMTDIVTNLEPQAVLQMMAYSWRALSGLLYEKCCLLGLRLEDRLVHELAVLARDFGRPYRDGNVVIDLPLTHADLGEFALASRANVARAMKRMEREGLVGREARRIVLRPLFFTHPRTEAARLAMPQGARSVA